MSRKRMIFLSSPVLFFVLAVAVVFLAEMVAMFILSMKPVANEFEYAVLDASMMVILSAPFLWWLIIERKRAEEALCSSETKFRNLVEQSLVGIYITEDEKILYVNPKLAEMLGYTQDEIISSKSVSDLIAKDDSFRGKRKDGTLIDLEVFGTGIEFNGKPAVIGTAIDITERRMAERALKESEEKYRTLIDNIQDGIFISQDARMEFVNEAFARITGYTVEEVIGKNIMEFIAPENLEMVVDRYHRRQAGENVPREYEVLILKKDKKTRVIINMNVGVITYRGRVASMGTVKDITERKRAEEQIKVSLKEKEVLLREIHHRVKNNMQIIASLLRLQSNYIREEKYREILKESQNRIMSMSLIHEKLYQSKDMAKIDFKNYIRDVTKGLLQSYGAGNIVVNLNIEDISLGIDSAIPCGLIINELVTNSLKHAFPNAKEGEIEISLRPVDENMIELKVRDNGAGMPDDVDFRNTKSLGLQLVAILTEQLHGEIDLNRGNGTEFKIKFRK